MKEDRQRERQRDRHTNRQTDRESDKIITLKGLGIVKMTV